MTDRHSRRPERRIKSGPSVRVVSHHPWRQGVVLAAVIVLSVVGALAGFWLGRSTAELDVTYVASIERLNQTNQLSIEQLEARLIQADLTGGVDRDAAQALKNDIRGLKDEVAALTEEVTFYKSLMAPSSVAKGLQIADFELSAMEEPGRYTFHLLLTQVESRRDWVQGEASLTVEGRMRSTSPERLEHSPERLEKSQERQVSAQDRTAGSESATVITERVLPLTEIGEDDSYPLKFRFRYFQDLTGVISLPVGFEPERIVVRAGKRGASTDALTRSFDWTVAG